MTLQESMVVMFYLHDALEASNSAAANAGNDTSDNEGILDEDCDNFASIARANLKMKTIRRPPAVN